MPAPTQAAVISSIPLYGPSFVLGQVTNQYQPTKVSTWDAVIPASLLGNEAIAGYAAFTSDGVTVTRGFSTDTSLKFFVGIFANYNFWEGDAGTNPYNETFSGQFTVPVCSIGSIYVYNSTAVSTAISASNTLNVVISAVSPGVTPIGSFCQGSPVGTTLLDVSSICKVKVGSVTAGTGILIDVIQS